MIDRFAVVCQGITEKGKYYENCSFPCENVLNFLDTGGEVDARIPDAEKCEETEEQQIQCRAEIQQALDDMSRHESIMVGRS